MQTRSPVGLRGWRTLLAAAATAFLVLSFACGGDDDSSDPTASRLPTGNSGDHRESPSGPPGTVGALPLAFPDDFPLYDPLTPLRGADFGDRFTADWRSTDEAAVVIQFYVDALSTTPWETTALDDTKPDVAVIDFTNDEAGYSGQLALGAIPDGGTRVILNLKLES